MNHNKFKNKIASLKSSFYIIVSLIKFKFVPEKKDSITKDEAIDLYSILVSKTGDKYIFE